MKTSDVKCNIPYLYNNETITVVKRIRGEETVQRQLHSGCVFEGYKRTQKKFLLSNGEIIKADKLKKI